MQIMHNIITNDAIKTIDGGLYYCEIFGISYVIYKNKHSVSIVILTI